MAKNRNGLTAEQMIEVIKNSRGFVTEAADKLGVSRQTFYTYLKKHVTAQRALEDARERRHEMVENKLMSLIAQGNVAAVIFYLKTQAKHLGYVERQEITGKDGSDNALTIRIVGSNES